MKKISCSIGLFIFISLLNLNALAASSIGKNCPNGINPQSSIRKNICTEGNPDENGLISSECVVKSLNPNGKCFKITDAFFVYLVDKHRAIYRIITDDYFNPLFLFDFSGRRVKNTYFIGTIKGAGSFKYKDGRGIPRTIPRAIVLQEETLKEVDE